MRIKASSLRSVLLIATICIGACAAGMSRTSAAPSDVRPKPLKALLVIGGCCHEYDVQKDLLKQGLEKRVNVQVDIAYSSDKSGSPPLPILGNPNYAQGYDVVIHDECAASIADLTVIQGVLAPHRAGIPGVNLHCGVHSYRVGNPSDVAAAGTERARWFEYLGLQSSGHGPQLPITVRFTDAGSPLTRGLVGWTTQNEELYNN